MLSPTQFIYSPRKLRRENDLTSTTEIPDACYDACNNAALEAQVTGKTPSLCEPNSDFEVSYDNCLKCIQSFASDGGSGGRADNGSVSLLSQFVEYCNSVGDNTDAQGISSLLVSWSSAESAVASLQDELSSKGYNLSTTTDTPATTTPESRVTLTVSQTATSSSGAGMDGPGSNSPNTKVIVPAVVVPVVVCLVAAVGVIWTLMRRRRRRQMQQNSGNTDEFDGKAQLHADEFRQELEAMTTAKEKSTDSDKKVSWRNYLRGSLLGVRWMLRTKRRTTGIKLID